MGFVNPTILKQAPALALLVSPSGHPPSLAAPTARAVSFLGRFDQFAKRSVNDPYWRKPVIAGMGAIDVKGSISQAIASVQLSVNLCRG